MTRAASLLAALLVAVLLLAGPGAAASEPAGAQVTAQAAQPAGGDGNSFGPGGDITDVHGISIWDYTVDGRRPGALDIGQFGNNIPLGISGAGFYVIRFLVAAIVWLLTFALEFGVADILLTPVTEVVGVYQSFVDQLGLVPLALMLCVFWFGLVALRGRVGKGAAEIVLSFVIVVVLGAVLAAPGRTLLGDEGLLGKSRDVGSTVAMLAVQDPAIAMRTAECPQVPIDEPLIDGCLPEDLDNRTVNVDDHEVLGLILEKWLVDMFVRQPHQYIVYGQRIDCPVGINVRQSSDPSDGDQEPCQPHPCLDRYNEILRTSPADIEEQVGERLRELRMQAPPGQPVPWEEEAALAAADPASYMYAMMHPDEDGYLAEGNCDEGRELALYNASGDWGRVAITAFTLVALFILFLFVAFGVLVPLIVGQVMLAVLAVALVFVLPVALLGGGSRRVLWRWLGLVLGALFMIIVALIGLSLMLITTDLLLRTTWHMAVSMLLVCIGSVAFLMIQRRLLKGGLSAGTGMGAAIGRARLGGTGAAAAVSGAAPESWNRPADSGLDWVGRRTTFSGYRDDLRQRAELTRRLRTEDRVQRSHPEFQRRALVRQEKAREWWKKKRQS